MVSCLPPIDQTVFKSPEKISVAACSRTSQIQRVTLINTKPSLFTELCEAYCSWKQFHRCSSFFPPPKLWEQVAAVNKYDPPPEVVAAKDHMTHVMYSVLQPQRVFDRYVYLHFASAPEGGTQGKRNPLSC